MEDNPQAPQQQPAQNRQQQSGNPWPQESQEWYQYLLQLSDALRSVDDPIAIEEIATRLAMQSLDADRCYYCQVVDGQAIISRDARRSHLPSVAGTYPLSSFPLLKKVVEEGRPFIVEDAHTTPLLDEELRAICLQMHIIAFLNIPVIKQGKPIGILCLVQSVPRRWTELEIQLQIETAERIWAAVERAKAEAALRHSEEKYRTLFNSIDEGVVTLEVLFDQNHKAINYRYIEINPALNRLTGLTSEVLGKSMSELYPGEKPGLDSIQKVFDTGQPHREEHYVGALDRWFDVHFSQQGGTGSNIVICVYTNITERKRREANLAFLAQISQEFAPLLDAQQIMERVGGQLGDFLQLSRCVFSMVDGPADRITALYEWRRDDSTPSALGSYPISALLTPAGRQHYEVGKLAIIADTRDNGLLAAPPELLYESGNASIVDAPYLENGRWKFLLTVVRSEPGEWRSDETGLIEDLTARIYARLERARAEEALVESEKRLRLAIEATELATWEWHLDTNEVYWNEQHFRLFGMEPQSNPISPDAFMRHVHPQEQMRIKALLERTIAERVVYDAEFLAVLEDGTQRWLSGYGRITEERAGQPVRMSGVMFDVDERRRAEDALRQADRRKDEFLAMLAHELRNPMSTIRSGLQILSLTDGADETSRATIAMMNRQTDYLVRMVDDLLDVSRISQGKIELKTERLNLVELVSQAAESVRLLYQEQGKRLQVDLPQAPIYLVGDATRLTQVVANLLTNGARYTGEQGQVWLSLAHTDNIAILRVRDNGIGLGADRLEAIFELFVQVDNSAARSKGGLGLGLTLVKRLVELHGGQVQAQSDGLDQGSTFTVQLPTLVATTQSMAQPVQPIADPVAPKRILVIDDNADAGFTLAMLLKLKGYEVHTQTSGRGGLEAAEALQPSAILLDIGMPVMDGYETCRLIRQQAWGGAMVIIALTGYGQAEDRQRTQEAGFDGHLVKPVDLEALTNLLTDLLDKGR